MKKIIKISCIIVISILVLWLSLYLVDNARYRKGNKPLFTLKTKNYLFFDGKVTEYDSLLYKMIVYNRKSMKETSFKAIWKKIINDSNDIYLTYKNKDKCDNSSYTFYEDENYKYNLECKYEYDVNYNGKKYSIKDALDKKILTIDELEKYITFDKQEK